MKGDIDITKEELLKRMNGCSISLGKNPYEVNFIYNTETDFYNIAYSHNNINELKGSIAFKGIVKGKVRIINTIDDMSKFEDGDIIVSIQSSPALMPVIVKCCAIITDEGGIMCHASVISRELKKPCIIGTKIATKVLKDGDLVEVDADSRVVRILEKNG
jgi:phosphoenolpyruvate synthase/pyruvate phosphate dikinase